MQYVCSKYNIWQHWQNHVQYISKKSIDDIASQHITLHYSTLIFQL